MKKEKALSGDFGKVIKKTVRVQNKNTGNFLTAVRFTVKKKWGRKKHYYTFEKKLLGDEWIEQPNLFSVFWSIVIIIVLVCFLLIFSFGFWLAAAIVGYFYLVAVCIYFTFLAYHLIRYKTKKPVTGKGTLFIDDQPSEITNLPELPENTGGR